eukprot:4672742-Ditylum_brightwellii.AAC.1
MVIDNLEITWDYAWETEGKKIANKPDIVVIDKLAKMGQLIDAAVPYDTNIVSTTAEKITKYRALELRLKKMFSLCRISTVLIVVGTFHVVAKSFENYVGQVSPKMHLDTIQKTAVLTTEKILQHILTDNIDC